MEAAVSEEIVSPLPGKLSQTSFTLRPGLSLEEWIEAGRSLRALERGIQFWVGDWMAYGEAHYGEEAFADLERQDKTLANWAAVARGVDPARRREDVRFSHHAEVAPLKSHPEIQEKILARVAEEDLTVTETRDLVRREQQEIQTREFGEPEVVVMRMCPTCHGSGEVVAHGSDAESGDSDG